MAIYAIRMERKLIEKSYYKKKAWEITQAFFNLCIYFVGNCYQKR